MGGVHGWVPICLAGWAARPPTKWKLFYTSITKWYLFMHSGCQTVTSPCWRGRVCLGVVCAVAVAAADCKFLRTHCNILQSYCAIFCRLWQPGLWRVGWGGSEHELAAAGRAGPNGGAAGPGLLSSYEIAAENLNSLNCILLLSECYKSAVAF